MCSKIPHEHVVWLEELGQLPISRASAVLSNQPSKGAIQKTMQLSVRRFNRCSRGGRLIQARRSLLTTIAGTAHTTRYSYDAAGRRTAKTTQSGNGEGAPETPMTASFDAANRMTAITLNPGTASAKTYTLSYDANGNLTQKQNSADAADNTLYTWDADNRLSRIEQGGANPLTATFTYGAMGRRIQSSITKTGQPTATVQYLYEGAQALGEIRDGKLSHRLLAGLGLDETIARIAIAASGAKDPAASRIFLTDALNSVIAQMSDADDPTLQTSYGYSPYGQSTTVGTDSTNNPIQYTSRENDGTGLYYYRARYYDPVLGSRFISEDPIGLAGGWNWYGYVEGNPISYADPNGLNPFAGAWAGAGAGSVLGPVGTVVGGVLGFAAGAWLGWNVVGPMFKDPSRPADMTPIEERQWDRHCKNEDDRCAAIKAATRAAISAAFPKMNDMFNDPKKMFDTPHWGTHGDGLAGRIRNITAMISLGKKMGCDMSQEEALAITLIVPLAPK
jgi:RHS repeat-associated protein